MGLLRNYSNYISLFMCIIIILLTNGLSGASEYRLGVGDLIRVSVWGHNELSVESLVRPDGYLTVPLVGDVLVVDRLLSEVSAQIETALESFIINPQVTVMVAQFRKNSVQVLGEVRNPGFYTVGTNDRLMDALGLAGGPTALADLNKVSLTRRSFAGEQAELISLNLNEYIGHGVMKHNPILQDGDVIHLTAAGKALVLGEVKNPGGYVVSSAMDVLDLLAVAGGPLEQADLTQATLTRINDSGTEVDNSLDLDFLMKRGKGDWQIQPDDVLYIPAKQQVVLLGEVRVPGTYYLSSQASLLDILGLAGGFTSRANASQVRIVRGVNDEQQILNVDASQATQGKIGGDNPRLVGGDVIFVPEGQSQVLVLGEVRNPGYYQLEYGNRVLDAIAKAGGLLDSAANEEVSVTRQSNGSNEVFSINLNQLMANRFLESNLLLQGGDVLIIPEENKDVLVLGEVKSPGIYTIRPNERLLDIIARAGGTTESADPVINLTRNTGLESLVTNINLNQIVKGDSSFNYQLAGGDVVYVPKVNRRVLVLGEVQRPGAYYVDEFTRLLDVIALAGGTTTRALTDQIVITNSATSDQLEYINLNDAVATNLANKMLLGGEVVFVPEVKEVLVIGEVLRPGSFIPPQGARILDLLALAGGTKNNLGAQNIVLTRQGNSGEQVWVTDYNTLATSQQEANLLIQGGDVIFVPEVKHQVLVLGQVQRPGVYSISDNAKVLDAIALAGGPKERAALESVGIYRDGDLGLASTLAVGEDKLLFQGDANENPSIAGGDIIYVPETNKPNWSEIFGFMGGIRTFQQIFDWFYDFFDN